MSCMHGGTSRNRNSTPGPLPTRCIPECCALQRLAPHRAATQSHHAEPPRLSSFLSFIDLIIQPSSILFSSYVVLFYSCNVKEDKFKFLQLFFPEKVYKLVFLNYYKMQKNMRRKTIIIYIFSWGGLLLFLNTNSSSFKIFVLCI